MGTYANWGKLDKKLVEKRPEEKVYTLKFYGKSSYHHNNAKLATDVARDKIIIQKENDKNERRRLNNLIDKEEMESRKHQSDMDFNNFYLKSSKMKSD